MRPLLLIAGLALLVGCSSSQPAPGVRYTQSLRLAIDSEVNPYGEGDSHPVVLRLYQLSESGAFQNAPFIELYRQERELLGASLIDVLHLPPQLPGREQRLDLDLKQQTRYLAVLAEFADYGNASAKALLPLDAEPAEEPILIHVSGLRVSISMEPASPWWKVF
ncbi:type VI secretion system lipoprotein TssJ [Marinobacterium aestuariivivens]|uniref:Type VI secretion system lipoprotein TssJ n=1 Tax=Marinobacterium aestuariivivens TaxID=1698799 RepID=A0ABW1ZZV4_9GAMM